MVVKRIDVRPDSEVADVLRQAKDEPLVLVLNGTRFRVQAERLSQDDLTDKELWSDYDPESVLEGLRAAAGSWKDIDGEKLKQDIYRWRREGSRPFDKP
jgi:hypothetical protein